MDLIFAKEPPFLWGGSLLIFDGGIHLGPSSCIACEKEIYFGKDVGISWNCLIWDGDGHFIYDKETKERLNPSKPIHIGSHVWIGCNTCIAKGSVIKDNSIIASYSKVTHELDSENAIYAGNRKVKDNVEFTWIERK